MKNIPSNFYEQLNFLSAEEIRALSDSFNSPSPISIRLNPAKSAPLDFNPGDPVPWCRKAFYLPERPLFAADPLYHAGAYYVQEAGSMFLDTILQFIYKGDAIRALDLCAAPGGKSSILLSALSQDSFLLSNEIQPKRASILKENLIKWGYPNMAISCNEPSQLQGLGAVFDLILVDAPCSGEGMFRKDEEAIRDWSPQNVQTCVARQKDILELALRLLKPGGYLIYATCTFNKEENEVQLLNLARRYPLKFIAVPYHENWGVSASCEKEVIAYRFFPHKLAAEGFFISVMQKESDAEGDAASAITQPERKASDKNSNLKLESLLQGEFSLDFDWQNNPHAIPRQAADFVRLLKSKLKLLSYGIPLGIWKGEKFVPDHALAMSISLRPEAYPSIEIDRLTAQKYLMKQDIRLPAEKALYLLRYKGLPLGFINHLGNRINNLYPMNWRLRSDLSGR